MSSMGLPGMGGDFAKGVSGAPAVYDTSPTGLGLSPAYLAQGATASSSSSAGSNAELAYQEFTANVTITAATEGTATTVVTAPAYTFDGVAEVLVEFYSPFLQAAANAGGNFLVVVLYEDGVSIGRLGDVGTSGPAQVEAAGRLVRRLTPTAGSHTFSARGYRTNADSVVGAGAGGNGNYMPGYIRVVTA